MISYENYYSMNSYYLSTSKLVHSINYGYALQQKKRRIPFFLKKYPTFFCLLLFMKQLSCCHLVCKVFSAELNERSHAEGIQ